MRKLPTTLLILIFASAHRSVAASAIDFSFYPSRAQDCLYQASNSSNCAADTVAAVNSCLCFNGGNFVTNAAGCLARTDPGDIESVYSTMKTACADSKTPLGVSKEQYLAAAASAATTTSPSTTTTSPAATNREQQGEERMGLSAGARAGIIAGSSVAGIALLAGLAFFILRRRRRRDGEESHPMLPQGYGLPAHSPPSHQAEAGNNTAWVRDAKWRPTLVPRDGGNGRFDWESPYDVSYPKPPPPLTPTPPLPPHARTPPSYGHPQVYELVGSDRQPTEMPGSMMFEVEGSPAPRQGEWCCHAATFDAADTSYPSQLARRTSR